MPENKALGDPLMAAAEIWWGAHALSGSLRSLARRRRDRDRAAGLGLASRRRAACSSPLSLLATAALPWVAFVDGHPFRIRYMVPLIAVEAIGAGARRRRPAPARRAASRSRASALLVLRRRYELRPLDRVRADGRGSAVGSAERAGARARHRLPRHAPSRGEKIMASMGSLGHYMQEASRARLRDCAISCTKATATSGCAALERSAAVRRAGC